MQYYGRWKTARLRGEKIMKTKHADQRRKEESSQIYNVPVEEVMRKNKGLSMRQ